jgi:secondary thiamine-phosphate synthase enzyme
MFGQSLETIIVRSPRQGLFDITRDVADWLDRQTVQRGLLTLFCRHTSASLLIQENASPAARRDLEAYFARIAPEDVSAYEHGDEGLDDMPAHLRTALTQTHLAIPVDDGRLMLGTWQGMYLFEHLREPRPRQVSLHLIGE